MYSAFGVDHGDISKAWSNRKQNATTGALTAGAVGASHSAANTAHKVTRLKTGDDLYHGGALTSHKHWETIRNTQKLGRGKSAGAAALAGAAAYSATRRKK